MLKGKIYVIQHSNSHYYKIGITSDTVFRRVAELQTGNPYTLIPRLEKSVEYASLAESMLHERYWYQRGLGEWFYFDPEDEKHSENIDNVIAYIKNDLDKDISTRLGLIGEYLNCPYCNNTLPNQTLYNKVVAKGFCSRCNPRNKMFKGTK